MWPNSRISVMGGEQVVEAIAQLKCINLRNQVTKSIRIDKIRQPIIELYESHATPYYSSARLGDDGIIDPLDTRNILGLAISASLNKPIEDAKFGVFRM